MTNVTYTPRAFPQICLFVLSLYTVGRLVTLPCEICAQSPVICVTSHYSVRGPCRDVTELANIRIRRMQISCAKSVGCGFVAQSKLLAIVGFVATVIQVIQLSYLKLSSCKQLALACCATFVCVFSNEKSHTILRFLFISQKNTK